MSGIGRRLRGLGAAAAELALGSVCAGCEQRPGLLCPDCRDVLCGPARRASLPSEASEALDAGMPAVVAVADYEGAARAAVLAHKEHGRLGLARPLGDALAISAAAVLEDGCPRCGERALCLVPVPSARRTVRSRGHDPLVRAARRAAAVLRRVGHDCAVVPALRQVRAVADQAGLGAAARRANLASALGVRSAGRRLLDGRCILMVDDVVTTGATLREAARALRSEGHAPCGAAVVAATPRRVPSLDNTAADSASGR